VFDRLNLRHVYGPPDEDDMRKYHAAEYERLTGEPADPDQGGQAYADDFPGSFRS